MHTLAQLRTLSDSEVVVSLDGLIDGSRRIGAAIVSHLVVVKERSIHLDLAHSSIVDYCVERLGCSKDVAYKRSAAVKVAQAQPVVLEWLETGDMTLSALVPLARHCDDGELVQKARGLSKRDVQKLVARTYPDQDRSRVQARIRSVARGVSKLEVEVPEALIDTIEAALDLDSHLDPGRSIAALLGRALDAYVAKRKRERFAVTDRPRAGATTPTTPTTPATLTKRVPAATTRTAYESSGGRCEYVADDGRRCSARAFLEIDHVVVKARGGGHDSIRILCRNHNQRAAEHQLGVEHMSWARRRAQVFRDLRAALVGLGFSPKISNQAAGSAIDELGLDAEIEALIREALAQASPSSRGSSRAREPRPVWKLQQPAPALVTEARPLRARPEPGRQHLRSRR